MRFEVKPLYADDEEHSEHHKFFIEPNNAKDLKLWEKVFGKKFIVKKVPRDRNLWLELIDELRKVYCALLGTTSIQAFQANKDFLELADLMLVKQVLTDLEKSDVEAERVLANYVKEKSREKKKEILKFLKKQSES